MASTALAAAGGSAAFAQQLPTGGALAAGGAVISQPAPSQMVIDQSSARAIINWNTFSIGQGGSVAFNNGTGATLNRVTGNVPSRIDGTLTATGSLFLVNPAGIAVGTNGAIATGGSFVASTHAVTDRDFMAGGDLTFSGASQASVVNAGKIGALGGDIALIARKVENTGTLTAENGTVGLAAGYEVLVRDAQLHGGKFHVKVGGADTEAKTSGTIRAANAELRANGGNVYALAGNTKGIIAATGVTAAGGRIYLTAGTGKVVAGGAITASRTAKNGAKAGGDIRVSGGKVKVTGALTAAGSGPAANGANGGSVVVEGDKVTLAATSSLDVRGAQGGVALVGGDWQGGTDRAKAALAEPVKTASRTQVEAGARLLADGTDGAGGTIVVWADGATSFAGTLSARGAEAGDGGRAEVSGKGTLAFSGTADLRAVSGRTGNLLLDPYNLTISNAADANISGTTATGPDSVLNAATLLGLLATANVTVSTGTGTTDGQTGHITVAAPLTWSSASTLRLEAAGSILINADITATGAGSGLVLQYGASSNYVIGAGSVTLTGAGATLSIGTAANLEPYVLIRSMAELDAIDTTGLSGKYALAQDLDAAGITYSAALVQGRFNGVFAGLGHTISNLSIISASDYVGLFAYPYQVATIRDIGLIAGSVAGGSFVGSLIGYLDGGQVVNAYATTNVTGSGLYVGGLVGDNGGVIQSSYASGAVNGSNHVGGLAGWSFGQVVNSYATSRVTGSSNVGGLVGTTDGGFIINTYATGPVVGGATVGGLIGNVMRGTVSGSFWDAATTGVNTAFGAGSASATMLNASNAYTQSTYGSQGWDFDSVWFMVDGSTRPFLRMEQSTTIRNSHQLQLMAMDLTAGYRLATDINLGPDLTNPASMWRTSTGFVPVGDNVGNSEARRFSGSFDGQGHVISNLKIDRTNTSYVGLFGYVTAASRIENVTLASANVTGGAYVGSLAGYNGGVVDTVHTNGTVSGSASTITLQRIGGLVGENRGGISNSTSTGSVSIAYGGNGSSVGGLAGYNGGTVDDSSSSASVTGSAYVGGLVGMSSGQITNSVASGAVIGGANVGGLVGLNYSLINDSHSVGSVTGVGSVGGLVGSNEGSIDTSFALGEVTGNSYVGGLVGAYRPYDVSGITHSYSEGAVHGINEARYIGGLIGEIIIDADMSASVLIDGVYAQGDVTGRQNVGGLIGAVASSQVGEVNIVIRHSYASGVVTGETAVGGFLGVVVTPYKIKFNVSIDQSYAAGNVSGVSYIGGFVGLNTNYYSSDSNIYISSSYANGAVSGDSHVGGLIGSNTIDQDGAINILVSNSYARGAVGGTSYVGGLIGSNINNSASGIITIVGSYWDTQTTGQATGIGTGGTTGVTGLTTAEFQDTAVFMARATAAGWSFTQTWAPSSAGYYPELYALSPVVWVKANDTTRAYGATNPAFTEAARYGGPQAYQFGPAGDTLTFAPTLSTTATAASNVGAYAIAGTPGSATSSDGVAYRVVYSGTLTVDPAVLLVTATTTSGAMVYGTGLPTLGYTTSGWQNGQGDANLSGVTVASTAPAQPNVGTYTVSAAGGTLSGDAAGNYTLAYVDASFSVTPATLVVAANTPPSVVYGTGLPAFTASATGWAYDQSDANLSGVTFSTDAGAQPDVGSYTVSAQGGTLSGAASGNYALTYASASSFAVTPATLVVAANTPASVVYGTGLPVFTASATGWAYSQSDSNLSGVTFSTDAGAQPDVGTYAVSAQGGTLSGAASGNYTLTYAAAMPFSVTPATLVVAANTPASVVYGAGLPGFTTSATGWAYSQSDANLSGVTFSTDADAQPDVGTYSVSAQGGTLSGAASGNYTLTYASASSFAVTPATLVVAANTPSSVVYGTGLPGFTASATGWAYDQSDANLSGVTFSTDAGAQPDVGTYSVSAQGGTLSGAASGNYTLTYASAASFAVTPRPITVTAEQAARLYGDLNPVFAYTLSAGTLVDGDTLSGALATRADAQSGVGLYEIGRGTLANANYAISYVPGVMRITPRPITVAANDQSIVEGAPPPALTWHLAAGTLVNGDGLSGSLVREPGDSPGRYAILQGSLVADLNYDMGYLPGLLTITPRPPPPAPPAPAGLLTLAEIVLITALTPPNRFVQTEAPAPFVWSDLDLPTLGAVASGERQQSGSTRARLVCLGGAGDGGCASTPHPSALSYGRFLTFRVRP